MKDGKENKKDDKDEDCDFLCEFKKFWLKSRIVILNILTTIITSIMLLILEFKDIIVEHFHLIQSLNIDEKYILLMFIIVAIANVILRIKTKDEITTKRRKKNKKEDIDKDE